MQRRRTYERNLEMTVLRCVALSNCVKLVRLGILVLQDRSTPVLVSPNDIRNQTTTVPLKWLTHVVWSKDAVRLISGDNAVCHCNPPMPLGMYWIVLLVSSTVYCAKVKVATRATRNPADNDSRENICQRLSCRVVLTTEGTEEYVQSRRDPHLECNRPSTFLSSPPAYILQEP